MVVGARQFFRQITWFLRNERALYKFKYWILHHLMSLIKLQNNYTVNPNFKLTTWATLTDKIREQLDSGNFACQIFVDLQKAFDIVDHDILTQTLNHYGIRVVANNRFSSYLHNRPQYVSINGFNSNLEHIHCGVSQGSILGPLLFLFYISDLNRAIR